MLQISFTSWNKNVTVSVPQGIDFARGLPAPCTWCLWGHKRLSPESQVSRCFLHQ